MAVSIPIVSEFDGTGIKKAVAEFKQLEGAGAKAQFALKKAALPAAAAIGGLAVVIGDATKAAIEDAKAQALLAQAIQNNTLAGEANVKVAEAFIEKTMMQAAVADDELRPALASLVQVTGEMTSAQDGLTLALDIAAATGVDLGTATDAIAKAYGGNTKALGTLLPSVRSLIKEGASLDEVFAAVAGTVGGSAAVAANSAEGQMKRLSLTIGETKESIGAAFLPILEKLLPYMQRFALYAQQNSDTIVKVMVAVGGLAAAILALNAIVKAYTVVQIALNIAMTANPIGVVVVAIGALVAGFALLVSKTGGVKNAFMTMGNFIIGVFEKIVNSFNSMINLVIKGVNMLPGVNIPLIPEVSLPKFNISAAGGASGASGGAVSAPDFIERQFGTMPAIPAPVGLPAPTAGGGGGGSRGGGGGGGDMVIQPFDPSAYDAKSRYYEVPAMLDAAYAPKQAVYNITVNAAIAEATLGDKIVDALTDYNRRSGPLDIAIA
jgi:uncharacterized membrane protein YgcG